MQSFALDPAFVRTSHALTQLGLCEARLQADARWPWIVLIPRRAGLREIEELAETDRTRLLEEWLLAGRAVRAVGQALGRRVEKLNLGALGNLTAQLHAHVVGRRSDDPAWPGPVWGVAGGADYQPAALERARTAALEVLRAG